MRPWLLYGGKSTYVSITAETRSIRPSTQFNSIASRMRIALRMMKPQPKMTYQLVNVRPRELEYGVIYISQRYNIAIHLCACGCGLDVPTQLGRGGWNVQIGEGNEISVLASIGNWSFPCRSHYIIQRGAIQWAGDYTPDMVAAARLADNPRAQQPKPGFRQRLWHIISSWFAGLFK